MITISFSSFFFDCPYVSPKHCYVLLYSNFQVDRPLRLRSLLANGVHGIVWNGRDFRGEEDA
jgi:hypothetical protein